MSPDETVPGGRCGFTYDVSTLPDIGETMCWRPVWEDEEWCIWHADRDDKEREDLEEQSPCRNGRLDGAIVRKCGLDGVDWFEDCALIGAELTDVDLRQASFVHADLRETTFDHVDLRETNFSEANLEDAGLDVCDLRHARFTNVRLDQAVFSNTRISRGTEFGETTVYRRELDEADDPDDDRYLELAQAAIWTNREIRELFQENALPIQARHFYLREKSMRRRIAWHVENYKQAIMAEGSRWVTGYGVSPWRVLGTSLFVIVVSALLYPLTGGIQEVVVEGEATGVTWEINDPEAASRYPPGWLLSVFLKSLYFSVVTFTTLGYGDISPLGTYARAIAGIEALTGTALMAMLVWVLARRIQ
jgi:hypothetical protein